VWPRASCGSWWPSHSPRCSGSLDDAATKARRDTSAIRQMYSPRWRGPAGEN
jgi:hypothetical protein